MRFVVCVVLLAGCVYCDYDCVCNYKVQKGVYLSPSSQGQPVGYLDEFECKQLLGNWSSSSAWVIVAFKQQVGYIENDDEIGPRRCAYILPSVDMDTVTSSTLKMPPSPTTTIRTETSTTQKRLIRSWTLAPLTNSSTLSSSTSTTTPKTPPTTLTTMTSSALKQTTTTPPIPTTALSTMKITTTHGQLYCPHNVVTAAHKDKGLLFVSEDTRKCYELVKERRKWYSAECDCQNKGGHLVTIRNQIEEGILYTKVNSFGSIVWIGLHDQNREEHFEWISGEAVTYINWHQGHKDPHSHRYEDCVAMGPLTGTWDDMDCQHASFAYICEFAAVFGNQGFHSSVDGNTQLCSSTVQHRALRDNGILGQYRRGCYELIPNKRVSWQYGETLCQRRGGHLVHISNAQQQSFIQSFLHRYSPQHAVWIGLHDTQTEGAFEWTAGTALSYTNWIHGHMSNFASFQTEDCVVFIPYENGKWDDISCGIGHDIGETHPIVCQYEIHVPLSPGLVG